MDVGQMKEAVGNRAGQMSFGFDSFLDVGVVIIALVMLAGVGSVALSKFGTISNSSNVDTIVNTGNAALDQLAGVTEIMVAIALLLLVVIVLRFFRGGRGSAV